MNPSHPTDLLQRFWRWVGLRPRQPRAREQERLLVDLLQLVRITEERSRTLEYELGRTLDLQRGAEERSRNLELLLADLRPSTDEHLRVQQQVLHLHDLGELVRFAEERTRTLEHQLQLVDAGMQETLALVRITEERSRSQHYELVQARHASAHQLDLLQKWYVESAPVFSGLTDSPLLAAAGAIRLETEHPIAEGSNDHIEPESTVEGAVRPTDFVAHCIDVLGPGFSCLDLGTGAGGLVYEGLMQGVFAFGLDGSDHCRRHRIGYWPLLPHNLRTCDITMPYRFADGAGEPLRFRLVTCWEVLEHIPEGGIDGLLRNVRGNLASDGYFMGSISLLEYNAPSGRPYHVTLQPKAWWRERFLHAGLEMLDAHPFVERLFARGNGPRFQDVHNYADTPADGFHFVARPVAP